MISLELAQALKKAGLQHKPEDPDEYWVGEVEMVMVVDSAFSPEENDVWMPRLDQLLAEIERRGWDWWVIKDGPDGGKWFRCRLNRDGEIPEICTGNTTEEAVGRSLLWLLQH